MCKKVELSGHSAQQHGFPIRLETVISSKSHRNRQTVESSSFPLCTSANPLKFVTVAEAFERVSEAFFCAGGLEVAVIGIDYTIM